MLHVCLTALLLTSQSTAARESLRLTESVRPVISSWLRLVRVLMLGRMMMVVVSKSKSIELEQR